MCGLIEDLLFVKEEFYSAINRLIMNNMHPGNPISPSRPRKNRDRMRFNLKDSHKNLMRFSINFLENSLKIIEILIIINLVFFLENKARIFLYSQIVLLKKQIAEINEIFNKSDYLRIKKDSDHFL